MAAKKTKASVGNPLLNGGEERAQSARWTHDADTNVGTTLLGRLIGVRAVEFEDGKAGEALIFSPAVVLDANGEIVAHRHIETLFSAALGMKITTASDMGVTFGVEFTGTEKSKKKGRTAFKTFNIVTQDPAMLAKQLRECGEDALADSLAVAK